jgi:hypothetical protein
MTQITKNELIEILKGVDKSTFVSITMETPVKMNKTGNPYFGRVTKRSSCNYLMGNDYEKRVTTNGEREGVEGFKVGELSGKKHISKCVLIDTKTETTHYVMVERFDEIHPKNEYLFEGNRIEKQLFQQYMVSVSENKSQPQERKVMVITPKIDNIREMSINKEQYEIV